MSEPPEPPAELPRARRTSRWLLAALALPLVLGALELRLPKMTRPLWEDEVHHNMPVLRAQRLADLDGDGMFRAMQQPKLDYAMRKELWFPLFGVNERALRLPALVWGMALVLLVYLTLFAFLRRRIEPRWAVLLAFIGSLWIVVNPMEVLYATEARHYSFIAFASTLWFAVLLLFDGRPRWLLALTSVVFVNTHFFALPLVAAGYALQLGREVRDRAWRAIPLHLAALLAVYLCTTRFNAVTFELLLTSPPDAAASVPLVELLRVAHLGPGLALWVDYCRALDVPPSAWAIGLVLVIDAVQGRRRQWIPTLFVLFVLMPAMLVYMKARSSHPFGERYFSAFFGLGLVLVAALLDAALRLWRSLAPRIAERRRFVAAAAAMAGLALLCGAPRFCYGLVANVRGLQRLPRNFSPYFRAYNEVVRDGRDAYVVHSHCFTNDIPGLYFYYILRATMPMPVWPTTLWLSWDDALGCENSLPTLHRKLDDFLVTHMPGGGVVVLDDKERECGGRPLPAVPPPASVEPFRTVTACMWKVRGVTTRAQLADVAERVGFSAARNLR